MYNIGVCWGHLDTLGKSRQSLGALWRRHSIAHCHLPNPHSHFRLEKEGAGGRRGQEEKLTGSSGVWKSLLSARENVIGGELPLSHVLPREVGFLWCHKKKYFLKNYFPGGWVAFICVGLDPWISKVPSPSVPPRKESSCPISRARIKAIAQSFHSIFAL